MKIVVLVVLLTICNNAYAQKIFLQEKFDEKWQYIYPFKDKTYVLAIQYGNNLKQSDDLETAILYFGKIGKTKDIVFWKNSQGMLGVADNVKYDDYNNDGTKDILIFEISGGRGGNEYYNLFLVDEKRHQLTPVQGFNTIVNPTYDKKFNVILGYGYAGSNYYSVFRIDESNRVFQIGKSFEDTENLDLEAKIELILRKKYK